MYRGTSPIFDVPEFPTLRRVKPLPKRRRTSGATMSDSETGSVGNSILMPPSLDGLQLPGPDATAEELLAHADTLSARMALQSYYMPILGGVQDFLSGVDATLHGKSSGNVHTSGLGFLKDLDSHASSIDFGAGYGTSGREEEDEHGEGDYIDHLQQPGNTKKRKVPANAASSPRGNDAGAGHAAGQDEPTDRGIPTGRPEHDPVEVIHPPPTFGMLGQKKGKLTAATLAGLQHKEMLKSRKRQLAAVLGALSHGDTLALDQALSANYPFASSGFDDLKNSEPPRVRLSRRRVSRLARAVRLNRKPRHPDAVPMPACDFTFVCPSATADRLIATKEEVAMLRNRFEAELARQAAKAAKLAAANKMMASLPVKGGRSKRAGRAQQRARTITAGKGDEQTAEFLDQTLSGIKPRGGKKKKRSALANASNPHHLRNYVPSRLPHSGQTNVSQTNANAQTYIGPLPLRFLSAEIPPRRRKKSQRAQPTPLLTNPADEWICAFCEYDLFYGDEQGYRRAVRSRKKILRRRRRARERAAAAASGNSMAKAAEKNDTTGDDYDAAFDPPADEFATIPKQTKWKGDPNKEKERGGEQTSYG